MKTISQWFIQGLLAILPIAITLSILYWLGATAEATLGRLISFILPDQLYVPGMGIIFGFASVIFIGLMLNAYIFRKLASLAEYLFSHIPLVRLIYSSVRDIAKFASASQSEDELQSAVLVQLQDDIQLIGFITDQSVQFKGQEKLYAVYTPMSYQIGGYTLFLPESRIRKLDMSVQDAMRYVLTAAMASPDATPARGTRR